MTIGCKATVWSSLVVWRPVRGPRSRAADKLEYNRDIRPILAENCFACHGPDSAARKADLRLDRRDDAVKAEAIVPGKPDDSELIDRITSAMTSRRDAAAEDAQEADRRPEGDAQALDRRRAPSTSRTGRSSRRSGRRCRPSRTPPGSRNPIDRFILAELEKQGLTPAPEADRRTLARRAEPRPDRPAAGAGRGRGVRQRPVARRLREATSISCWRRRTGASTRPLLARRGPLRRHARHPLRQLPRDLGLPRLGHQRLQPQHAVRPVHHRAAGRRPAAQPRRSTSRSPPASTAATSPPTKAASSPRNTWCSTRATAPRRPRRSGWA